MASESLCYFFFFSGRFGELGAARSSLSMLSESVTSRLNEIVIFFLVTSDEKIVGIKLINDIDGPFLFFFLIIRFILYFRKLFTF